MEYRSMAMASSFQSTPSAWRVTIVASITENCSVISIHTLRMEGDFSGFCSASL